MADSVVRGCLMMLVGLNVADEDKCVVIFNLLHGRLGSEGVLDDVVSIHLVPLGCGLTRVLRLPGWPVGVWPVELDTSPDLLDPGTVHTLHHPLLHLVGLLDGLYWCLLIGSLLLLLGNLLRCRLLSLFYLWSHSSLVEVNQAILAWSSLHHPLL